MHGTARAMLQQVQLPSGSWAKLCSLGAWRAHAAPPQHISLGAEAVTGSSSSSSYTASQAPQLPHVSSGLWALGLQAAAHGYRRSSASGGIWSVAASGKHGCHQARVHQRCLGSLVSFPLAQTGEGISECELIQWFAKVRTSVNASYECMDGREVVLLLCFC